VKLAVVIPARNEAGNIGRTLDRIRTRLVHEGVPYEIVVVDDGSTDGMAEAVRASRLLSSGSRTPRNGMVGWLKREVT
jgi:glycosyltransferase involved in cell wall biosynthesis